MIYQVIFSYFILKL